MESKSEEDFWNTSSTSTFNFDDEEDCSFAESSNHVFNPTTEESNVLPIHTLISKECLNIILDDVKSTNQYVVPPIEETIKKMFHGQKFQLYWYRTLEDKLKLLDAAVETGDGNIIVSVISFLEKSLKRNIFYNHISTRKVAVNHYANYLIMKGRLEELADLYMVTGNPALVKDVYYLLTKESTNKQMLVKKLEQFLMDHSSSFNWMEDLQDNLSFLKWQIDKQENADSVLDQLAILCKKEWEKNKGDESIQEFKQQFKVDDFQFDWVTMQVLCTMELWKKLISTFIKPSNWLAKKTLKTVINPETFILAISKYHPPSDALDQFLQCMPDNERGLELAQKLEAHKFVINYYINQKDRSSLITYRGTPGLKPEEILLINNALQATDKKWKN